MHEATRLVGVGPQISDFARVFLMQGAQFATLNGLQLKPNPTNILANVLQVSAFTLESFFLIRTADQVLLYSLEQRIASIAVKATDCWISHDSQDKFIIALKL